MREKTGSDPSFEGLKREPRSVQELMERAWRIAGLTLGELGSELGIAVPDEGVKGKGVAGQIVERALGATAASRAEPDFVALGIELKTIPLDVAGKPKESTFVASISLSAMASAKALPSCAGRNDCRRPARW